MTHHLPERVREVREDFYGHHGAQFFADALGLPLETWTNYEQGVIIPAEVILRLIMTTGASPRWLLYGEGPKYAEVVTGAMSPARHARPAAGS